METEEKRVPEPSEERQRTMEEDYRKDRNRSAVCLAIVVGVLLLVTVLSKCGVLNIPTPVDNLKTVSGETVEMFENITEYFQEKADTAGRAAADSTDIETE